MVVSAQLSNKFGNCPSYTVSIVFAFHKHNSIPLGQIRAFISFFSYRVPWLKCELDVARKLLAHVFHFIFCNFKFETRIGEKQSQCDQTARLVFNFWPFTTMKMSPIASAIRQSRVISNILPKWRKFPESGHTGNRRPPTNRQQQDEQTNGIRNIQVGGGGQQNRRMDQTEQRTLTVGGRITVRLVSSFKRLH